MPRPESRAGMAPQQPITPERIAAEFPEASIFVNAVDTFIQDRQQQAGSGFSASSRDMLLLKMASDAHPGISLRLVCAAYGMDVGATRTLIAPGLMVAQENLTRCKELADKAMQEERQKLLNTLSWGPVVMQDQAQIREKLLAIPRDPHKTGTKPDTPNHVRRLSIVRRLRAAGLKHSEIALASDIKNAAVVENLAGKLIKLGLIDARPVGPTITDRIKQIGEVAKREREKDPKITYKEIAKIASQEVSGAPVTRRQVKGAMEHIFKDEPQSVKSKKTPMEEYFALIDLFVEEYQGKFPDQTPSKKEIAEGIGMDYGWFLKVYRKYTNHKQS